MMKQWYAKELVSLALFRIQLIHRKSLVLIDDLMPELDNRHVDNIFQLFQSMDRQFFITCQPEDLPTPNNVFIIEWSI